MNYDEFYDLVYTRDNPISPPSGWIQWKGTSVCIDLHCSCGEMGHVDGDYFYFYECKCGKRYAVGQNIKLIELSPEEAEHVLSDIGFTKAEHEDDL